MHRPSIEQQVTFLYASDLDASARFYEDVFGFECVLDQGACRIYRVASDAFVGFCSRTEAMGVRDATSGVILTLVTADVDAWSAYLIGEGVTLEQPPRLNDRFNIYHCFVRDPAGYLIEIQRFQDPAWPEPLSRHSPL
jgi:catechol 2,3-dioxygenase-like lactoylglutathione lyase family enzyme